MFRKTRHIASGQTDTESTPLILTKSFNKTPSSLLSVGVSLHFRQSHRIRWHFHRWEPRRCCVHITKNSVLLIQDWTRRCIFSQSPSAAQSIHKHECTGEKKSHGCRSYANARGCTRANPVAAAARYTVRRYRRGSCRRSGWGRGWGLFANKSMTKLGKRKLREGSYRCLRLEVSRLVSYLDAKSVDSTRFRFLGPCSHRCCSRESDDRGELRWTKSRLAPESGLPRIVRWIGIACVWPMPLSTFSLQNTASAGQTSGSKLPPSRSTFLLGSRSGMRSCTLQDIFPESRNLCWKTGSYRACSPMLLPDLQKGTRSWSGTGSIPWFGRRRDN